MVLEKARLAFEQNKAIHAVRLTLCVIHEMIDLLEFADDSDGDIGGVIDESFAFIYEITEDESLSLADQESIFHKLMEEASDIRYEGWTDWRLELLNSCTFLADTPIIRDKLENCLISMIKNEKGDSWSVNYFIERINLIRYRMIEQYDGKGKAQEFISKNLQYPEFRRMAIEMAMKKKDYESVIELTLEGEKKDENSRGLVNEWKKSRYKAFQLLGRLDGQRGIAMDFILEGSFEYYMELKVTYDQMDRPSVYPQIISLLEKQKNNYHNIYTEILIEEGEKEKLLEYVKRSPSSVEYFYQHLFPEFQEEVYVLFLQYIESAAERANKRKDYQRVCAIIRNLKKVGGKEQALEIKQKLFSKYANRPAFRDELSKM